MAKQDEFYTQIDDIANELQHYKHHFRGKVVFCNCDGPYEIHFFKYFTLNFNTFGLKKRVATCYDGSSVAGEELPLLFKLLMVSSIVGNDSHRCVNIKRSEAFATTVASGEACGAIASYGSTTNCVPTKFV